eukprot:gb/GECG01016266.1/.p1 GENE.gb/GECG01016266.1/~~gb/GECG01016266.1/.p1  ORF type:complete len:100 (+),score=3.71 gb/GECG01016266.1/:1-300(+)
MCVSLYPTCRYGHGKSEEVLGEILPEFPRNSYYLHTKVGRYDPDPVKMFDFRASTVRDSVERSLERMKASYLDTVQGTVIDLLSSLFWSNARIRTVHSP